MARPGRWSCSDCGLVFLPLMDRDTLPLDVKKGFAGSGISSIRQLLWQCTNGWRWSSSRMRNTCDVDDGAPLRGWQSPVEGSGLASRVARSWIPARPSTGMYTLVNYVAPSTLAKSLPADMGPSDDQ